MTKPLSLKMMGAIVPGKLVFCYCFDEKAQICLQFLITFQNKSCLQKMGVMHIIQTTLI